MSFSDRSVVRVAALAAVALHLVLAGCNTEPEAPPPPPTRVEVVSEVIHGVEVDDPYRWLEDLESEETQAWIDAQNDYAVGILDSLPNRDRIRERLTSLLVVDFYDLPLKRSGRYFFSKLEALRDREIIAMREGIDGEDVTLIDPHPWDEQRAIGVELLDVSDDGSVLAYRVRDTRRQETEIRLFDVDAREDLPEALPSARYEGFALRPDGRGFYYAVVTDDGPRVRYHGVGSPVSKDREIFDLPLEREQSVWLELSSDGRHLLIHVRSGRTSAVQLHLYDARARILTTVVDDIDAHFVGRVGGDRLYLATNWQAPAGRVLVAPVSDPVRENWSELVPARPGEVLESISLAGELLFLNYLVDVSSRVIVFSPDGGELRRIDFGGIGTVSDMRGCWGSDEAFFAFNSFHVPPTIYRYDTGTGTETAWYQPEMPIDPDDYKAQQFWYRSKDGTEIPMFIVHRKGTVLDGRNRTLLSVYGGFGVSRKPVFALGVLAWLDDGGIFAIPNIRGGGEFGSAWHDAGKRANKQNTIDDAIAAAEWLISRDYASSDTLAISGGSHGGLVSAALITQRPGLVRAALIGFPILDMVRYQNVDSARYWEDEFGSIENPEEFEHLYALSPYHHVERDESYPGVLILTGSQDTRVPPHHAYKMAAILQARSGSGHPVLLRSYEGTGHGGRPIQKALSDAIDTHTFLRWQLSQGE